MTKIDIISGFLGAGKTTLIKKLIQEAYQGEKLVLIENEFGDIGIDGGFLQEAGIEITEMNSGCICCSLVGDFGRALEKVITEFAPERILIEPSGVGKLSDVIAAVKKAETDQVHLGAFTTVVDATSCDIYLSSFGEFYENQIRTASCIILSRTDELSDQEVADVVNLVRQYNEKATLITTAWPQLTGVQMQAAMEGTQTLAHELAHLQAHTHHHHHHDECDDPDCGCHEHHHQHHHDECDDPDCGCHEHHHQHHHDECDDPDCGCHEHHHHHGHHHADEVFTSWGRETTKKYASDELAQILQALDDKNRFGYVLRAKGIVEAKDGTWLHFDHVPGEADIRQGSAGVIGRLCVIGSKIDEAAIAEIFGV